MRIFDDLFRRIEKHNGTRSSALLAQAMASACSDRYTVSLASVCAVLDSQSKEVFDRLVRIVQEPDFSNADQDRALDKLRALGFID